MQWDCSKEPVIVMKENGIVGCFEITGAMPPPSTPTPLARQF
jgi:hypothetical protein